MQTSAIQGFRLSYPQRRIWLLQQQDVVYRAQAVLTVSGLLDRDRLRQAIAQVVERHDLFRTTFHSQPSLKLPLQVISRKATYTWLEVDLSQDTRSQAANLADVTQMEWESSFELERGPLLRVTLLALAAHEHRLIITLPALLADARTLSRFVQEVSQHYGLAAIASLKDAGLTEPTAEPPVQYLQFSEWQHELLEEPNAEAGKAYWQQQLVSTNSTLPFELHPLGRAAFRPQANSWQLPTDLTRQLGAIAHHHPTSVATVLFTTWQLLLWRLHSESEVGMGWVTEGRPYDELAEVMGAFAQTIPIRNPWANSFSWRECLQRTASTLETAQTWQDYFTGLDDRQTQTPQFLPYSFEFTQPWELQTAAGVTFTLNHQSVYGDRFKLKLSCQPQADTLCLTLHFDASCFEQRAIACLADQYQTLLGQVAADPEITLAELNLLSPSQRQRLLNEFNPLQQEDFTLDAVHHRFARQAEQTPDAIALVFDDQQLTYAELNYRAEQLAHHLKGLGVGAEKIVALYLERSLETVIGLLGVLKAGGAYLPVDPTLPAAGLRDRLQDAQAAVLLTQQRFAAALSPVQIPVLYLDAESWTEAGDRPVLPDPPASDCLLAYVIYTSGSTGQPKGVAVEHRQLSQYLNSILEQLGEPLPTSFAIASTFAADLGHTITFAALCTGGCLHILSAEQATNAAALAGYCQTQAIDCLKLVPSHLAALFAAGASAQILPQQWLILGGEAATWELIDTVQQHTPSCRILNHYGPTETTVGALTYAVPALPQSRPATVPLGHPLPHAQVYVLDDQLQPVAIGIPGELYIGGAGLARGYLNRPDATAEGFIPHPFSTLPGSRLYKTGDRARYRPDGSLEFLGRADHQVKLRGYRVELGEIEAALRQCPTVQAAISVLREDVPGLPRLVAYVIAQAGQVAGQVVDVATLHSQLQQRLPDYMVPAAILVLKAFPLLPNGKINRQALPTPAASSAEFVAPRNSIEERLAQIWAEVLQLEQVGIQDNFFDLGGHSLLATQIMSRLRQSFLVELPLYQFFEAPTVAELAIAVSQALAEQASPDGLADLLAQLDATPVPE